MDSNPSEINALFAKDVFGFGLSYYENDYTAINGATPLANVQNTSHAAQNSADLYNGNIRYMQTSIINPLDRTKMPMLNAYKYDQLNRLKESRSYENGLSSNTWNPSNYGSEYYNAFTYDAMGNILTQERHNRAGEKFDDLEYHYQKDANGNLLRNRLYSVSDDPNLASVMEDDIEDMGAFISAVNQINTDNNYSYDAEGRLVKDKQEEIDTIIWTVSGKVKEIRRSFESTKKNLIFEYDAFGNRIAKHVYDNESLMLERSTYYILDAQGNQLSMYEHSVDDADVKYYLTERNIYGSSRLGTLKDPVNMFDAKPLPSYGILGNRNYELSNHLGNVLTVISDIKYPLSDDYTTISGYEVGISNIFDYSPFGAPLDGRTIQNIFHHPSQNNGSQTQADTVEIYNNDFDNPPATGSPYLSTEVTLDAHLSNTTWTSSTGAFTNYNSSGAGSGKSIAITTASADTAYLTLTMDVDSGYELDITSYSFAHRSSSTGYDSYKLVVNGIEIGTGSIYVASSGSTLQSTGVVNVSNVVSGVTGTVNVVLKLYGGLHGSTGTFRMDDFILNGYTQEENTGNGSGNGYVVMGGYRYGFNGFEADDEVSGEGNSYTTMFRQYDPRLGRWKSLDPKRSKFPYESPYVAFHNNPIFWTDPEGDDPPDYPETNGKKAPVLGTLSEINLKVRNEENKNFVNNYVVIDDVQYSLMLTRTDNMLVEIEDNIYQDVGSGKYYSMHFVIDDRVPPRKRDNEPRGFYVFSEVLPGSSEYNETAGGDDLKSAIENTIEKIKDALEKGVTDLKVEILVTNGLDERTGYDTEYNDADANKFRSEIEKAFPDVEVTGGEKAYKSHNTEITGTVTGRSSSPGYKQVKVEE